MALSATFTANFSSFYDAVDKAEVKLKDFGGGAEKAGAKLNAMAQQFSGQKIIQEATLMAKAIGDVENYAKLTDKELAKVAATATEAVAKLKALGKEVPKDIQQMADATKGANKAATDWMGTLTKVAGAVGIAFSVDAVVGFVGSVFEAAAAVKDLGNQWGFSTQAVQQWKGAARDAGVSTESLGKSIQHVTAELEKSDEQYDALLKNIGLSGEKLRGMKMEDAYKDVLKALEAVTDETLQYDMALAILGPSAKQVIGGIRDGIVEATDAQKTMSDETIKRLADAEDAWGKFKDSVIIYSGEMLAAVMDAGSKMTKSWTSFFTYAAAGLMDVMGGSQTLAGLLAAEQAIEGVTGAAKGLGAALAPVASHGDNVNQTMKTAAQIAQELADKKERLRKQEAARAKALAEAKRAEEAYTAALKKHDDALDDLVNSFGGASGQGAIGKANLYLEALRQSIPIEQMSVKAKLDIHKAMDEAIVSYQAAGQMAPKVMYDIWLATRNATEGVIEFSSKWKNFTDLVTTTPIDLGKGFQMAPPPELTPWKDAFTSFADTIPAIFEKAMSARGPGMAKVLGAQLTEGLSATIASAIAKGMEGTDAQNNMAAGMGVGIVVSMFSEVFRNIVEAQGAAEGFQRALAEMTRDMHADLVGPNSPYEDFEDLEAAANALGITFVDVWNPDGVTTFGHHLQERINEFELLRKAAEFQAQALDEVTAVAEKYGFTLEELGPAMQRQELDKQAQQLFKDWELLNSAGIDTVAITERMAEAVNDYVGDALSMGIEIPSAMRPMLESFVKAGTLLDENGEIITDLEDSGISFAMTMSEGFTRLIDKVSELTDAISRGLGLAIENIPQPEVTGTVRWHVEGIPQVNDRPGGGLAPEYAKGTDGFVNFGKGTPVILHGWEAVVPRDQANATVTGGGGAGAQLGGGMMTVIVEADGRQLSRIVAPFIPGEVRRLGLAHG